MSSVAGFACQLLEVRQPARNSSAKAWQVFSVAPRCCNEKSRAADWAVRIADGSLQSP
jgi:hypothetical protein